MSAEIHFASSDLQLGVNNLFNKSFNLALATDLSFFNPILSAFK